MTDTPHSDDSTTFRTASNVGFNARVEPFFHTLECLRPKLGFFEYRRQRKRLETLREAVEAQIVRQGADPRGWTGAPGTCVCNLRVARLGLLNALRGFAVREGKKTGDADPFPHLLRHRERNAYYLPVRFPKPFTLAVDAGDTIPVGSAAELADELDNLNRTLAVERTFRLQQMVDFLDATPEEISRYESRHGTDGPFWVCFGFVVLRKLARRSLESSLPVIFA